ncbi:Protein transport protein Sec61 subunit alpha [Camellia lanceoleosa]|uniref:Protein transport protein Sec61 subunit alpha n=1 Tax=Camellia lanceoleosa TaxID=1840588 RepID=A0ACC0IL59_9ERIC|nr:Protein transport protein Sec61 subunit alpha [Camellia lanceoleosa]
MKTLRFVVVVIRSYGNTVDNEMKDHYRKLLSGTLGIISNTVDNEMKDHYHKHSLVYAVELLYRRYSGNFLVNLLGKWKESEYSGQSIPVGGITYYITAPSSLADMAANPFHALFYLVFMLSACALFSKTWIEALPDMGQKILKLEEEAAMLDASGEEILCFQELCQVMLHLSGIAIHYPPSGPSLICMAILG